MLKRETGEFRLPRRLEKSGIDNTPDRNVIRRDKRNDPREDIERGRSSDSSPIEAHADAPTEIFIFSHPSPSFLFLLLLKENFFRRRK